MCDLSERFAHRLQAALAHVKMEHNVLYDYDCIIDDQPDRRCEAAQCHQVETFADYPQKKDCNGDGYGNHKSGNERGNPILQE